MIKKNCNAYNLFDFRRRGLSLWNKICSKQKYRKKKLSIISVQVNSDIVPKLSFQSPVSLDFNPISI